MDVSCKLLLRVIVMRLRLQRGANYHQQPVPGAEHRWRLRAMLSRHAIATGARATIPEPGEAEIQDLQLEWWISRNQDTPGPAQLAPATAGWHGLSDSHGGSLTRHHKYFLNLAQQIFYESDCQTTSLVSDRHSRLRLCWHKEQDTHMPTYYQLLF